MIVFRPRPFAAAEWSALATPYAGFSLIQTFAYGEAKAAGGAWRAERGAFEAEGRTVGAAQVLVRSLPAGLPGGLAWVNRAPLWRRPGEPAEAPRLGALLAALRRHYVEERGFYLRVAPAEAEDAVAPDDLVAAGLQPTAAPGWASAVLDLGPDAAALRRGLEQKWRNALNKAERTGVAVREGGGDDLFERFLAGHRALLAGRGFATSVTPAFLAAWRNLAPADERPLVLAAEDAAGRALGAILVAFHGATAEYLAGNVDETGRKAGAGQLLLWRAVCAARARGCACFDVGGMDPRATPPGILRFKEGLKARPYRLAAEAEALPAGALPALVARLVRWRVTRARAA